LAVNELISVYKVSLFKTGYFLRIDVLYPCSRSPEIVTVFLRINTYISVKLESYIRTLSDNLNVTPGGVICKKPYIESITAGHSCAI
jgi:hypothetical protein